MNDISHDLDGTACSAGPCFDVADTIAQMRLETTGHLDRTDHTTLLAISAVQPPRTRSA